uniref:Uncharacterized protein n=1 Tax=Avena sativa TaxID=4498 RepID=A0ACD5YK27_AVESA
MLRLRSSILPHLLSSPATYLGSSVHRLFSATAPRIPPSPSFAVEEYLTDNCGLTRAQALKASAKLSHLKSPSKPDAVLAFLAGLGLSSAHVAAVVAKDPQFLCAKLQTTLAPIAAGLKGLGLSNSEIGRLVSLAPVNFRCKSVVSNIQYYLSLFGSYEDVLRAVKRGPYLLSFDLENAVKPTVAYLQECGLGVRSIAQLLIDQPWVVGTKPERLQEMVASAEALGVPRGSVMFRHALRAVAFLSQEKIAAQVENLKTAFRWSDAEVRIALCKAPMLLVRSKEIMQRRSEFFISEVGLDPAYIAHRPVMLSYSLEGRVRPRSYVLKFLKEKGLLHQQRDYYSALMFVEQVFMEKFICPHKEAAPHLAQDYAAACRGEVPTRFRFT